MDRASGMTRRHANYTAGPAPGRNGTPRVASLVAGGVLCVFAVVFIVGGGLVLWKDRAARDANGFVSLGTTELRTGQYAIVGSLRGDGPGWLYGATALGDARVRATSTTEQPLFIGIARTRDVLRYLQGRGYATVDSFEVRADTTHPGGPPAPPPTGESIWNTSTQGIGQQTLEWTPRAGDWSVVFMNADAAAHVDVRGDASAELPALPWVAVGLLVIGGTAGLIGARVIVRANRRADRPAQPQPTV